MNSLLPINILIPDSWKSLACIHHLLLAAVAYSNMDTYVCTLSVLSSLMTFFRPRRVLVFTLFASTFLALYLLGYLSSDSSYLSTSAPDDMAVPNELFGLLWFVTAAEEQGRTVLIQDDEGNVLGGPVNPEKPIDIAWYALGSITAQGKGRGRGRIGDMGWKWGKASRGGWPERMRILREEHPLVVFSKVRQQSQGRPWVTYQCWTQSYCPQVSLLSSCIELTSVPTGIQLVPRQY